MRSEWKIRCSQVDNQPHGTLLCWPQNHLNFLRLHSEQQLVDCSTANYGCNGGWQSVALQYIAKAGSVNTAAAYPYTSAGGTVYTIELNYI